ncbi:hypothetical protein [Alicyclobacillus acidiphilus]|uniref:hypothetical protein n=1 Tax=Alicyclobacillus acidiphilus TaxID=182455 RepID=UPI0009FB2A73|nr:hypothetical protein [Alicyclobacillus acidiphilus]
MSPTHKRAQAAHGIVLAKAQAQRPNGNRRRRPAGGKRPSSAKPITSPDGSAAGSKKGTSIAQLFTPKNLQETVKTVTSLRGMVKNWLGYLQQADRMLDTVYITTGSLKESGVLDKLLKNRGKNLTTEDYTSILAALMASPLGAGLLKGGGSDDGNSTSNSAGSAAGAAGNPSATVQQRPSQPGPGAPAQGQPPAAPYPQAPGNGGYGGYGGGYGGQQPMQPGYAQPYAQPNYGPPAYSPPGYPAPGYGMPSYGPPNQSPPYPSPQPGQADNGQQGGQQS